MVYDDETDLYLPIVFALMQDKSTWSYWHFIHLCFVLSNTKLLPSTITCDFEKALISSCREQFPKVQIIGCLFHFKQALRKK